MSTTLTLAPPDFQTFLQLCAHKTSTALLRNKKHKCKARTGRTGGRYKNLEGPVVIKVNFRMNLLIIILISISIPSSLTFFSHE